MNDIFGDEEIIEIFIEEAGEVFENMDTYLPHWGRQPNDSQALTEIRRGFHTLKGSGRMVNALDLAEVAWKIENLLNHAIEGTVQVTKPMVELVTKARGLMHRMLDDFRHQRPSEAGNEAEILMAQADALAEGKTLEVVPTQPVTATADTELSPGIELADLERRFVRSQQRADEALNRSEKALQEIRRVAADLQNMQGEVKGLVSRADVNAIIERVNLLGKEVRDLRHEGKLQQNLPPSHKREITQLVDHRVRERVAPIERQRSELERQRSELEQQLAAADQAAASARRLAVWALVLSLLVAGGVTFLALLMQGVIIG